MVAARRKNITQPEDWWAAFKRESRARGKTLSAFLGRAGKSLLPPKRAAKLSKRRPASRPPVAPK